MVLRVFLRLGVLMGLVFLFLALFQGGPVGLTKAAQEEWALWSKVAAGFLPGVALPGGGQPAQPNPRSDQELPEPPSSGANLPPL